MVNVYWGQQYSNVILPEVVTGTYGYYIIRSGFTSPYGYAWDIHRDSWALYLQDSWTINRKLTINAGVRAESE
jgi:outer membrane receptor protein involved in Fe transport